MAEKYCSAMGATPQSVGKGASALIIKYMRGIKINCNHCGKLNVSTANGWVLASASGAGGWFSHKRKIRSSCSISISTSATAVWCSVMDIMTTRNKYLLFVNNMGEGWQRI